MILDFRFAISDSRFQSKIKNRGSSVLCVCLIFIAAVTTTQAFGKSLSKKESEKSFLSLEERVLSKGDILKAEKLYLTNSVRGMVEVSLISARDD